MERVGGNEAEAAQLLGVPAEQLRDLLEGAGR